MIYRLETDISSQFDEDKIDASEFNSDEPSADPAQVQQDVRQSISRQVDMNALLGLI